ncbi:Hypothetical_protein [Hexamita inflata]|uniref:Hypothetical_protein n=1 Tax=Hexamita inflata TaxID=28002 RepID=A0AA86Q661_9EUKA|nr:Hypothetical protein HINF_LOCUS38936 [Hexamita inflata]
MSCFHTIKLACFAVVQILVNYRVQISKQKIVLFSVYLAIYVLVTSTLYLPTLITLFCLQTADQIKDVINISQTIRTRGSKIIQTSRQLHRPHKLWITCATGTLERKRLPLVHSTLQKGMFMEFQRDWCSASHANVLTEIISG